MVQRFLIPPLRTTRGYMQRFVVDQLLRAKDSPHRLALGVAIGVFMTFLPPVGLQMLLVVLLAWLLGANKLVGLPVVWINNPATFGPLYYGCYAVGRVLLGQEAVSRDWWASLAHPPDGWWSATAFYCDQLMQIAAPLSLGCLVVALLAATISYFGLYHGIRLYRRRTPLLPPRRPPAEPSLQGAKG